MSQRFEKLIALTHTLAESDREPSKPLDIELSSLLATSSDRQEAFLLTRQLLPG